MNSHYSEITDAVKKILVCLGTRNSSKFLPQTEKAILTHALDL
jgi:hypothetical protein